MLYVKTPEEVLALIETEFNAVAQTEMVPLAAAMGRVLAEDITATEYVPDFDRSTVDGYAVRARDTFGCTDAIPAILPLQGEVFMGEGAEFTLSHDTETCSTCRGDGSSSVEIADFVQTCTVENGGHISFTNIPSGHTYRLVETVVPDGYLHPIDCEVVVAYNEITVDGEVVPEDWVVINEIAYELPETGGPGTILYAAGGITMMGMAALLLIHKNRSFKDKYKLR